MKQIVLFKQSRSIQLAHLYEHMFCTQVDALFHDNGLFPYLDYILTGRAYQRGVVYISMHLYTNEAEPLALRVPTLKVSLNQAVISIATNQLIAEKEYAFNSKGYDVVKQSLEDLDAQPWQNLDLADVIDTKGIRRKAQPLYINVDAPLPARKLNIDVLVDLGFIAARRDLLPLFRQLALLVSNVLQGLLADKYGYYSSSDVYKDGKRMIGMSNVFKVPNGSNVSVEDNLTTCIGVVNNLQRQDAFARLARELRHATLYRKPNHVPSPENNFVDTGVLIGAEGWKRIATSKNCETLLRNMSIEINYGSNQASRKGLFRPVRD